MNWFRFYHEALDDPKVQKLDPPDFKIWVNLLCLACRHDGKLPPLEDIAFALRLDLIACRSVLDRLSIATLIDTPKGGAIGWRYAIHGWDKRQYKSDTSTDRVKRFRERSETVSETPPDTDTDTDTEQRYRLTKTRARRAVVSDDGFSEFWEIWPNKVGKPAALRAFIAARRRGHPVETIFSGVRQYEKEKPPERSWLNPATFLNQERFLDQPAGPTRKPSLMDHAMKRLKEAEEEAHEQASSDQGHHNYLEVLPSGTDWLR